MKEDKHEWGTHWRSLHLKGAIYSSQGTLQRMPGYWYSVLCSALPKHGRLAHSHHSHYYWVNYYRIKDWPHGVDRTPTHCLFSGALELKQKNAADAIAWDLMLRLQYQLSNCQHSYFLAHSGSRINSDDIWSYWRINAEKSLEDIIYLIKR